MKGHIEKALIHESIEANKLWHRRLAPVHCHLQEKLLKDFHKFRQSMTMSAKDVQKERTQRRHFQVVRARQKES